MGHHLELLQLSTDGPISDKAWRLAKALDALEAAEQRTKVARTTVRVKSWKPAYIVDRMALVIVDAVTKRNAVHQVDFDRAGITRGDQAEHFAAALTRAKELDRAVASIQNADAEAA